jgi:outer membrane protein OmpA-like peptidoglycan-associated protein
MARSIRRTPLAALAAPALACLIACTGHGTAAIPPPDRPRPAPKVTAPDPAPRPATPAWRDYVPERCRDEEGAAVPGCRASRVVTTSSSIEILDQITFAGNTAELAPPSYRTLDHVAQALIANPSIVELQVRGHSDSQLHPTERAELARKRAEVVAAYLVARGVAASRITTYGASDSEPLYPPDDIRNRRVELLIVARDD